MYIVNYYPIDDSLNLIYALIRTGRNFQVVEYDTDSETVSYVIFDSEHDTYTDYKIAHEFFKSLIERS